MLPDSDFFQLEPEHIAWYLSHGCVQRNIVCPAGSMVFWDSRTIHAGRGPTKGRAVPKNRYVVYVCMTPTKLLTPSMALKKQNACKRLRTTNHCPHKPKLVSSVPRTYGNALPTIPPIKKPILTLRGARLAGWLRHPVKCPLVCKKNKKTKKKQYVIDLTGEP